MNLYVGLPFAGAVCAGALGAAALLRRRRNPADLAFAAGMIVFAVEGAFAGFAAEDAGRPVSVAFWQSCRLLAGAFLPAPWIAFSLAYARGTGAQFLRRWRATIVGLLVAPAALAVAFWRLLVASVPGTDAGPAALISLGWPAWALNLVLMTASVVVLLNLERTYRAAIGTMRWRIKFMVIGVGLIFVVRLYTASQALLFRGTEAAMQCLEAGSLVVASALALRSFVRSRSVDLDIYPSRSALQGSFTILFAGIYLLLVGAGARLVAFLGGGATFGLEALLILVSLVVLVLLLQSDRLKLQAGRLLSRHFQRPVFDYRTVWRSFAESTASLVTQDELARSLVREASELFQCLSVAIWLRDEHSMVLAASTRLSDAQARKLAPTSAEAARIWERLQSYPQPADIESSKADWAALLRLVHPCEFPGKERRVCVPLLARGEVAGCLLLGDRVGGAAFTAQDYDMLACVADHAAASLRNIQLSQKLLQAKEFEAFQAMAAFLVHDLKNAASTLGLMLKNMQVHFDDPGFRDDALRAVGKAVDHVNHLIGRLSMLRHKLDIRPQEADLNEIVRESLTGLESPPDFEIEKALCELPRLHVDPEHLSEVITNLVINAREAMGGHGRIQVATAREGRWAALSVKDRGCGMTPEFIEHSLFRPFQTTKREGLGIGMFQSKMIVEVHGGRITAESAPEAGTTFRVLLPLDDRAFA